jgi:hypothetical protein
MITGTSRQEIVWILRTPAMADIRPNFKSINVRGDSLLAICSAGSSLPVVSSQVRGERGRPEALFRIFGLMPVPRLRRWIMWYVLLPRGPDCECASFAGLALEQGVFGFPEMSPGS